jgi:hypothetical protein
MAWMGGWGDGVCFYFWEGYMVGLGRVCNGRRRRRRVGGCLGIDVLDAFGHEWIWKCVLRNG